LLPLYFKKDVETLSDIVSKLAARDGLSINSICNSQFIRSSLLSKGFQLPKAPNSVMGLIHQQCELVEDEVRLEICQKIAKNQRFSISLDEFTSSRNRRYMNINVHEPNSHYNLGMIGCLDLSQLKSVLNLWRLRSVCQQSAVPSSSGFPLHRNTHLFAYLYHSGDYPTLRRLGGGEDTARSFSTICSNTGINSGHNISTHLGLGTDFAFHRLPAAQHPHASV
jgi:hypothetical protein